jgi:hypothetical protein
LRLSENFTLEEFLVSQTAARNDIDMTPSEGIIANLTDYCQHLLQPLRDETGPIFISSGYRPIVLNTLIGGSDTSAHVHGKAADFRVLGLSPYETCIKIMEMELPYDQVIHEFGRWTHMGAADEPRNEELTAYKDGIQTRYKFGIHKMEDI